MAKHAVTPHIPISDSERLIQAAQILKACIVANDTRHPFEINPSYTLQAVYALVQNVIEHRGDRRRKRRPGEPPTSITGRLQQAASILRLCIISNDAEYVEKGFDLSHPMHIVVALIDEAHLRLGEEMDKRLRERPSKMEMRALQSLRAAKGTPDSPEGKPN